jgi:hypothetical protein
LSCCSCILAQHKQLCCCAARASTRLFNCQAEKPEVDLHMLHCALWVGNFSADLSGCIIAATCSQRRHASRFYGLGCVGPQVQCFRLLEVDVGSCCFTVLDRHIGIQRLWCPTSHFDLLWHSCGCARLFGLSTHPDWWLAAWGLDSNTAAGQTSTLQCPTAAHMCQQGLWPLLYTRPGPAQLQWQRVSLLLRLWAAAVVPDTVPWRVLPYLHAVCRPDGKHRVAPLHTSEFRCQYWAM